ncbi:hypothetical protein DSECCO2_466720 [anaerobic digester metagenome]
MIVRDCQAIDCWQDGFHLDGSWIGHRQRAVDVLFERCRAVACGQRSGTVPAELYQSGFYVQSARLVDCRAERCRKSGFLAKNHELRTLVLERCRDLGSAYSFVIEYGGVDAVLRGCVSDGATRRALQVTASGASIDLEIRRFAGAGRPVLAGILDDLDDLAAREGYTKIFAKVPASARDPFLDRGYVVEARVPRLFRGQEDGYFVSLFRDPARALDDRPFAATLAAARKASANECVRLLPPGAICSPASSADAPALAALYRDVFATYPFPIHREAYIRETMEHGVRYFCIRVGDVIAAVSSAEMDPGEEHVEMTDFATRPDYRGHGLAGHLLRRMETAMRSAGMKTAYTIARATSFPMSITFSRAGYAHGGTLLNNTGICGGLESMHVWYRPLQDS